MSERHAGAGRRHLRRLALFSGLLAVALAAPACRRDGGGASPAASASAAPSARALDAVAPGELPEGKERFFGFPLPRDFTVDAAFDTFVVATGTAPPDSVLAYARKRVDSGNVELSAARMELRWAHVTGEEPWRRVLVSVEQLASGRTRLRIDNLTLHPPDPPGMTDEERWRRAGRTPDGKVIDPHKQF